MDEVLHSTGQPLDHESQGFFNHRFGYDFSGVRIHTDARAAASAKAIGALAYTVGHDVVFADGQFNRGTNAGRRLLAHELTHVVQQHAVQTDFQASPISGQQDGPFETQADHVADAVLGSGPVPTIGRLDQLGVQRFVTTEPAGGCGICIGSPQLAGIEAHRVVQLEFEILHSFGLVEFPFSSPGDENGRLDLALGTPTGLKIGEIKPANPQGFADGIRDLAFYALALQAVFPTATIEPLTDPIPPTIFPDPVASASGCPMQAIGTVLMLPGLYGYFCVPSFSQLRQSCRCGKPPPTRVKDPVQEEEKQKQREKDEKKRQRQTGEGDDREPIRIPVPKPEVILPTAVVLALLALALRFGARRVLGPAMVIFAIVLVSEGAEASVGLKGDDALEAMFKLAEQKGAMVPDDLKEAIKKDPALRKILTESAESGDFTEAKRQLGEKLTRVIVENRDQFSEDDIDRLLKTTEQAKGSLPNGDVTARELRKALDAARARRASGGADRGTSTAPETTPAPAAPPAAPRPDRATLPAPVRRLVDELTRPGGPGPRLTPDAERELVRIALSVSPPLTAAEVEALVQRISPADGKTIAEVLDTVKESVAKLRDPNAQGGAGTTGEGAGKVGEPSAKDSGSKQPAPVEKPTGTASGPTSEGRTYAELLKSGRYDFLEKNQAAVLYSTRVVLKAGQSFDGLIVGRGIDGVLFIGSIGVTPKRKVGTDWVVGIGGGANVYDIQGRVYSRTTSAEMRLII